MTGGAKSPMFQALARHRAIACLLALQVALAAAACANTFALLAGDLGAMRLPSGMDEAGLVVLPMPADGDSPARTAAIARLRALPGVRGVVAMGGTPFDIDVSSHASRDSGGVDGATASQYQATQGAIATLGLDLVAGRDFTTGEAASGDGDSPPAATIVSHALAVRLFGDDRSATGQTLYLDGQPLRIVGVVARLLRGQPSADAAGDENEFALLVPQAPDPHFGAYLLRTDHADARRIALSAAAALASADGTGGEVPGTLADAREAYFAKARADAALLAAATAAFLGVTAIGIFGLSFFWVRKRAMAIGIRRALGASRGAIVRALLLENAVVVASGNAAGALCALAANRWLVVHSGMPPLPVLHLAAACAAAWLVSAGAATLPALRAASVAPATALRVP